jgi:hypothetical protein
MASDYGPEIKASMTGGAKKAGKAPPPKESSADLAKDKARGIKQGSPQDQKLDAMPQNQVHPQMQQQMQGGPPDAHHVAAAAGIAHAILGRRGMM